MPIKKSSFERPPAAPIFRPSLKEFDDPLTYIEKIRPVAQQFGICKIISPKQWNPPFAVDHNTFKFRPRVQKLNEVGAHSRIRINFVRSIEAFWEHQGTPLVIPVLRGIRIDLFQLHNKVRLFGGLHQVTKNKQWTMVCRDLNMGDKAKVVSSQVKSCYEKLIQPYLDFCDNKFMENNKELFPEDVALVRTKGKTAMTIESPKMTRSKTQKFKKQIQTSCKICNSIKSESTMVDCVECDLRFHIKCLDPPLSDVITPWICNHCLQVNCARELSRLDSEVFGFSQSTCKYNLESFATYADNFKKTYFNSRQNVTLKEVEEEYWRLVAGENNGEDVTVKYGADISSGQTSSGFPTKANRHLFSETDQKYVDSGWNLNNLPVLTKSIFRFVSNDISGMTVPWCYVGMVFSCFCWHIEDHWSYSINYMHTGECKTWYGVPESDADLFEELMRKEAADLFEKSPDLLHHITTQINPTILMDNNVKVYRTDQAPGEFVVTFPRAYHAGFNQGFNFAEAVNFCPADWLNKGRASVESYRLVKRPSVFSHNELICKMASCMDSLDIVLLKAVYEEMVIIQQEEKALRKNICTLAHGTCRTERLQLDQIVEDDRECLFCRTTLYMSGVTCNVCCHNDRMLCLDHVQSVCTCATMDNIVLKYRFSLDEISTLVANVKNKLEQYNLWMTRLYHLAKSEFCSSPVSAEEGRVMKNVSQFVENLGVLHENDFSVKCVEEKPNLEELRMLLQLGKKMNCPELLLDFLEAIIDTCQRAMDMTDQLLKSHRTTVPDDNKENDENTKNDLKSKIMTKDKSFTRIISRHENQNDKLSLGEMRMLVEKLRSLPAHVPQLEEAAQTLNSINEWRRKVKMTVSTNDVLDAVMLLKLIESGESNLVYLSEYQMLQKMRHHALWVTEARQIINGSDRCTLPSLDQCKKLRDDGLVLINTVEIDRIATLSESLEVDEEDEPVNGNDDEMSDYRRIGWNLVIDNLKNFEKQLSQIICYSEAIQIDAVNILNTRPGKCTIKDLKTLLRGAENKLKCALSGIDRLKEVLEEALILDEGICEMWQQVLSNRGLVHIKELQAVIKRVDSFCICFDYVDDIKELIRTVETWKKGLRNLFIKSSDTPYLKTPTLLELLFPRSSRMFVLMFCREKMSSSIEMTECKAESTVNTDELVKEEPDSDDEDDQLDDHKPPINRGSRKIRGRQKRVILSPDDPSIARRDIVRQFESLEKDLFSSTYRKKCHEELVYMKKLRILNEEKANKDRSGHDFYCFCRKRGIDQKGAQVMCDLCQDWFHLACLGIVNKDMSKKKFLCPQCERSKRPLFEDILAEKQKIDQQAKMIRIPEYIVLSLMCQRVIDFHKHINQVFSSQTELGAVFTEYKNLFGIQVVMPKYQQSFAHSSQFDLSLIRDPLATDIPLTHLSSGKQSRKTPHTMSKSGMPSVNYSATAATLPSPVQLSPLSNKEALLNIHRLKASLSEEARRELEEIYIELCLLEVTQPTVTWIWKLYHSLIDDEDTEVPVTKAEKHTIKREQVTKHDSDNDDRAVMSSRMECAVKSQAKSAKRTRTVENESHDDDDDYIKLECVVSDDESEDAMDKTSFKRKLGVKNHSETLCQVKRKTNVKSSVGVTPKKRVRSCKRTVWDNNVDVGNECCEEENDEVVLENGDHSRAPQRSKRVKKMSGSIKSASDTKSNHDDDNSPIISKHASGRPQRNKHVYIAKSDYYSDDNSPSQSPVDMKPIITNQFKRGRKPSAIVSAMMAQEDRGAMMDRTPPKRRRRNTTGNSKRVCNDDCGADVCVQQKSDKVNWIACDICNLWYHWLCVDIKSDIQIDDRFVCPRCKDTLHTNFKVELISSIDDEVTEVNTETDDLHVILDDQVPSELIGIASLNRMPSSTGSVDTVICSTSMSQHNDHQYHQRAPSHTYNDTEYYRELSSGSPQPPFLQPECCVQEEVVEISYVSRSDSDY